MRNRFEIRGDVTVIFATSPDGLIETTIETNDLPLVSEFPGTWTARKTPQNVYYVMGGFRSEEFGRYENGKLKKRNMMLHRWIMKPPDEMQIDHINRDPLDNRRSNLMTTNALLNSQNRGISKSNRSGYRGVSWSKTRQLWNAYASIAGKTFNLGYYESKEKAASVVSDFRANYMVNSDEFRNSQSHEFNYHLIRHNILKPKTNYSSKYRGVFFNKRQPNKCWTVAMKINGKRKEFGSYRDEIDAAMVHDIIVRRAYGVSGHYNFPDIFLPDDI